MKLHYNKADLEHQEIFSRMKDMSLAFESEEKLDGEVLLEDGSLRFEGVKATTKHLDDVAGELHSWYYCNC